MAKNKIPPGEKCWRPGCYRVAKHKIKWDYKDKYACDGHKDDDGVHWVWDNTIYRKVMCRCKKKGHK